MVSDSGLYNMVAKGKPGWLTVSHVQVNVKSKIGCGQPIVVEFFAHIDAEDKTRAIEYDFRALGEDQDLIRNNQHRYCLKQVYKMCYYVSTIWHQEIMRMRCEFTKDDNNTIWFQHASEIWVRPNMTARLAMET